MCRCSIKRKYLLIWTPESEMKETISRVEKRGEELNVSNPAPPSNVSSSHREPLEDAAGSSKDRLAHQTHEVSVQPICIIDSVPELVSSDTSTCSARSQGESSALKDPPEKDVAVTPNTTIQMLDAAAVSAN